MNNFLIYYIIMSKSKKQKLYKMRGCSKKTRKHLGSKKNGREKKRLKGGNTVNSSNMRTNPNAANPVYPNTGAPSAPQNWINSSILRGGCGGSCGLIKGGSCGGTCGLIKGGSCGGTCGLIKGGSCGGTCGLIKGGNINDGNGLPYGQGLAPMKPILAPSGLTGQSWNANFGWPGTNTVGGGDHNHYSLNKYVPVDISRQTQLIGAQRPFLGGTKNKNKNKSRKQKGGALSNFLFQDFVNVGRQVEFGLGSAYNTLSGHNSPVNPMPWNQPGLSNHNVFKY